MRRMNYNPFNNVYASGEYVQEGQKFVLDKSLTSGIYFLDVYLNLDSYYVSLILKVYEDGNYCFTTLSMMSGYTAKFCFYFTSDEPKYISLDSDNNDLNFEGSTIKVYKIA